MGLPDGLGGVQSGLVTWGIPAVGGLVGVVLGGTDTFGVTKFMTDLIPISVGKVGMSVLTAALFAVLGTFVWSHFGVIGKFCGAFAWGYAFGTLFVAATGHPLKIPGFTEGV